MSKRSQRKLHLEAMRAPPTRRAAATKIPEADRLARERNATEQRERVAAREERRRLLEDYVEQERSK